MIVYGKRAKPKSWPYRLFRVDNNVVYVLGHGLWGRSMQSDLNVVPDDLVRAHTKSEVYEYDAKIWGSTDSGGRLCSFLERQDIAIYFPTFQLGSIADKAWEGIDMSVVSRTTYNIHGELFQWVQRSCAIVYSKEYPRGVTCLTWVDLETSLFTVAKAAEKQWEEWRGAFSLGAGNESLVFYGGPSERFSESKTWIDTFSDLAATTIKSRADAEKQKELRRQREEAEQKARFEREEKARKRREEEERKAAQRRAEEKRKAERARLKELMNKPANELSPEEFALRMRLKREQRDDSTA